MDGKYEAHIVVIITSVFQNLFYTEDKTSFYIECYINFIT